MKKIYRILIVLIIFSASGCQKDDFFDKFPPEIMFFQNTQVENADFNEITIPQATTEYLVKARVSSPFKLKAIKIYVNNGTTETLIKTIDSFGNSPNETYVYQTVTGISGNTDVKFIAWDTEERQTLKTFKISVN